MEETKNLKGRPTPMITKATRLSCSNLADLDFGTFGVMVDDEIRHICNDLDERGKDGQKRELKMTINFSLDMRNPGEPVIMIDPRVESKYPAHRSGLTKSRVAPDQKTGEFGLLFQAQNPENPDQATLLDEDAAK